MTPESAYLQQNMHLDAAELRHLRKLLNGEKRQLLDLQLGKKKLDDLEIRKLLGGITKGQLATLRAKLQAFVAETVAKYRYQQLPEGKVQALVYTADAYMNSPMHVQGQRTLAKALKLALHYGVFTHIHMMEAIRERLPLFLVGNKTVAARWPEIDQDLIQLVTDQATLRQTKAILKEAHQIKDGGVSGRKAKIEALWQRLPTLNRAVHTKTSLLLARTHWICDFLLGRVADCEALLDWAIAVSLENSWLWSDLDAFGAIEAAHLTKVTLVSQSENYEAGLALLDTFRLRCEVAKRFRLPELKEMKRLLTVRQLLESSNPREVKRGLNATLKEIGQPEKVHDYLYTVYLCVIEYLVNKQEFELSRPWLDLLGAAQLESKRVSLVMSGFVIELIYWCETGEMDELDKCTRRFLYFTEDHETEKVFANVVVSGFRSLAKDQMKRKQAANSFLNALNDHASVEEFQKYFEIIDLRVYLSGLLPPQK